MKHIKNGIQPGTHAPKNKAPASGNARAEESKSSATNFKPILDFKGAGFMYLWVNHTFDCPGAVCKVSQCKCNPRVDFVTVEEFMQRIRKEAKHGL
jgi:hypothetical protein